MQLLPVILSGGAGTRLWPLSRESYPKQFLPLAGDESLLQRTVLRLDNMEAESGGMMDLLPPLVVCNEAHRFLVAEQFRQLDRRTTGIVLEPAGRNTAPALALSALVALGKGIDPVLVVMPADHLVTDEQVFRDVVAQGALLAEQGKVVTFGIVPGGPETGYGYIRKGEALSPGKTACFLDAFVEKPDLETAKGYIADGEYLWNSGIFVMKASVWMELLERFRGDIAQSCAEALEKGVSDGGFVRVDKALFLSCPKDSIDYAVMEKLSGAEEGNTLAVVLPLDAGWSDVGAWSSIWEVTGKDESGNASEGDVFTHGARDNLVIAKHRMVAAVGVNNLIIVETPDAVLVLDKSRAQDVKSVTQYLKDAKRDEHVYHRKVERPWGSFEPIDEGDRFQVKRLTVKPGAAISLQMHHHRAEHWVVVRGTAKVTRDEEILMLTENQSAYIPLGATHRLENPGRMPLEIIEVQSGSYLGEDDIVRFEDIYNRSSDE